MIQTFERAYAEAVALERAAGLGRRQGPVQSIGPSYAAIGYLLYRDRLARQKAASIQRRKERRT